MPKRKKELVATFDGEEDFILGRGVYQSEDFLFLSGNTTQPTTGSVEAVQNAINTPPTPAPTPAPTRTPTAQTTTTPPDEGATNLPPIGTIGSSSGGTTTAPDIGGSDVGVVVNLPTLLTFDQLAGLTCDRLQARINELVSYADQFGRSQDTIAQGNYQNTLAYANQLYQTKCVVTGGGTTPPTEETTGGGTTGGGTTPPTEETTGGGTTGGGTATPPPSNILTPETTTNKAPEPLVVTPTPTSPLIIATGFPPSVGTPPPTGKGGFAGGGGGGKSEGGGEKKKSMNWLWILLIAGGVYYLYKRGNK